MNKLVTVYIPTYNRLELLERALDSVRHQTYRNLEIIIVDDCSTDNTHEYLKKISDLDCRVKYFIKDRNGGACESRNIAINLAQGEFITGLDDDDYFFEDRIEKFIKYWGEQREINTIAIFSGSLTLDRKTSLGQKKRYLMKKRIIKQEDLLYVNFIGNQVFAETKSFKELNGFDITLPMWQDFDMWYRLANLGNLENTLEPTYYFDISHNYTRITDAKRDKVCETAEYFASKHHLNNYQKKVLNNHLYHYGAIKKDHFASFAKLLRKILVTFRSILASN